MKKSAGCCVLLPLVSMVLGIGLGAYLLFQHFTVEVQVEGGLVEDGAYVFGTVQDTVSVPLVVTVYLVSDGQDSVWVATSGPLPQLGKHVLVHGLVKAGLKIPGKLGGGTLLKHILETRRWDLPI